MKLKLITLLLLFSGSSLCMEKVVSCNADHAEKSNLKTTQLKLEQLPDFPLINILTNVEPSEVSRASKRLYRLCKFILKKRSEELMAHLDQFSPEIRQSIKAPRQIPLNYHDFANIYKSLYKCVYSCEKVNKPIVLDVTNSQQLLQLNQDIVYLRYSSSELNGYLKKNSIYPILDHSTISKYKPVIDQLLSNEYNRKIIDALLNVYASCSKNNAEALAFYEVLNKNANLNAADSHEKTGLMMAACFGYAKICEILLNRGANVNTADKDGKTALMMAALNGHTEIIRALLDKGANCEATNNDGNTALMLCSRKGPVTSIKTLIEKGANINTTNKSGQTVLMYALSGHHHHYIIDTVNFLLSMDVNINVVDHYGNTPLMMAVKHGNFDAVDELLSRRVDVNVKNKFGMTALDIKPFCWCDYYERCDRCQIKKYLLNKIQKKRTIKIRQNTVKTISFLCITIASAIIYNLINYNL